MIQKEAWVCTDPTTRQYGRKLRDKIYQFKQPDINEGEPVTIYLGRYMKSHIEDIINSYGYTLEKTKGTNRNIEELYGEDADWVIAECIFEMEESPKI